MSSSSKKRQTMAKRAREQTVKERRAQKQEKRQERKQTAAAGRSAQGPDSPTPVTGGEAAPLETLPADASPVEGAQEPEANSV